MRPSQPSFLTMTLLFCLAQPAIAAAQGGRRGGMGGEGMGGFRGTEGPPAPPLPGAVLDGPPDSATLRSVLSLSDSQASRYAQLRDSFMLATAPQRDSVQAAQDKMNARLDGGDRAAASFYAERIQGLGKTLRARQDKFDDRLRAVLTGDQMKAYRRWWDDAERLAQERDREAGLRWTAPMGFGGVAGGRGSEDERRSAVRTADVAAPDVGAQAVRVGRTIYVSAQAALDSSGTVVGAGDLRAQAVQAFTNVTALLRRAGASPADVVRLTIYVVHYRQQDLPVIEEAGAAYFGGRVPPAVAVLGVESLAREGLLVAVEATAVTASAGVAGRP